MPDQTSEISVYQQAHFTHRGIAAEIMFPHGAIGDGDDFGLSHRYNGEKYRYNWCYYVYLNLRQFADQDFANSLWLDHVDPSWASGSMIYRYDDISWFNDLSCHCGITYYSKLLSAGHKDYGEDRIIKVGCDYAHYFDEGREYSMQYVVSESKATIESIHDTAAYLIRCSGDGSLWREDEGTYKEGRFYSNNYVASK